VIVNQRKMQLRTERRHPATSFEDLAGTAAGSGGPPIDSIADRGPTVSEQVERREVAENRHAHPPDRRAAGPHRWAMRYLEGRSPDEVRRGARHHAPPVRRLFERANTAINRKLLAYLAGDWCPGHAARFTRLAANRATTCARNVSPSRQMPHCS
jgi:hypothetical protein